MDGKMHFFSRWKSDLKADLDAGAQVVETKSGPVEYAIHGDSGPVFAGVHGGPGGYDQTRLYWGGVAEHGFRVLAWSRPGYLRTPISNGATLEEQADVLADLLDALKIDKAAVGGVSAGGPVCYAMAWRHPERVWAVLGEAAITKRYEPATGSQKIFTKVMFNDPVMWLYEVMDHLAPKATTKAFIKQEGDLDEEQLEENLNHIFEDPHRSTIMLSFIKTMSPVSLRWDGIQNDLKQLAAIEELPLKNIKAPTLVIQGKHDADVRPEHAEYALSAIPGARAMWVEDGFHILPLSDHSEEIMKRRVDFLNEHAPH
jgi:pimeloyl-ACP methyl ester carboxylesterase